VCEKNNSDKNTSDKNNMSDNMSEEVRHMMAELYDDLYDADGLNLDDETLVLSPIDLQSVILDSDSDKEEDKKSTDKSEMEKSQKKKRVRRRRKTQGGESGVAVDVSSGQGADKAEKKKTRSRCKTQVSRGSGRGGLNSKSSRQLNSEQRSALQFCFFEEVQNEVEIKDSNGRTIEGLSISRNFFELRKVGCGFEYMVTFPKMPSQNGTQEEEICLPLGKVYIGYPSALLRMKLDLEGATASSNNPEFLCSFMSSLASVLPVLNKMMHDDFQKMKNHFYAPLKRRAGDFSKVVALGSSLVNME
jgi:hypothetical protein